MRERGGVCGGRIKFKKKKKKQMGKREKGKKRKMLSCLFDLIY